MSRILAPLALAALIAGLVNMIALSGPPTGQPEADAAIRAGLCLGSGIGCGPR